MSATLLENRKLQVIIERLCFQLIETHADFSNSVLIGLQPRGAFLAKRLHEKLRHFIGREDILYGNLDITFYRDDFRRRETPLLPSSQNIDFLIEGKRVVLVDDVLFTGRTVRSALDALLDFGRPEQVELLVLVDRKYSRQLPIVPDYVGIAVDTRASQKVKVHWQETEGEDKVWLISQNEAK